MHDKPEHTILYFIGNEPPTEDDVKFVKSLRVNLDAKVMYRNGDAEMNGQPEHADFYAGKVPAEYAAAFPNKLLDKKGKPLEVDDAIAADTSARGEEGAGETSISAKVGSFGKFKKGGNPA